MSDAENAQGSVGWMMTRDAAAAFTALGLPGALDILRHVGAAGADGAMARDGLDPSATILALTGAGVLRDQDARLFLDRAWLLALADQITEPLTLSVDPLFTIPRMG